MLAAVRLALGALCALALAAALGLGATWWTVTNGLPASGLVIGVWKAEPDAGTLAADPYEIASTTRVGEAPLAYGDGLAFTAAADDEGRPLDASCDYELEGELPTARLWTLATFAPSGKRLAPDAPASDVVFTSAAASRIVGVKPKISLSRRARPGNWIPIAGDGGFVLRLSLYETVIGTPLERANPSALFRIRRVACS